MPLWIAWTGGMFFLPSQPCLRLLLLPLSKRETKKKKTRIVPWLRVVFLFFPAFVHSWIFQAYGQALAASIIADADEHKKENKRAYMN